MMMMMMMTPTRPSMMLGSWDSIRKSQVACKGWFNELDDWYCLVLSSMNWVALCVCYHLKSRDELTKSSAQLFHKIDNLLCTRFGWLWWFTTSGEGCGDSPGGEAVVIHHCWWRLWWCTIAGEGFLFWFLPVLSCRRWASCRDRWQCQRRSWNNRPFVKRILCWEYFSCQSTEGSWKYLFLKMVSTFPWK